MTQVPPEVDISAGASALHIEVAGKADRVPSGEIDS
jgi:hypothetical protein